MSEYIVDIGFMSQPNLGVSIREEIVRCRDCKYFTTNIHRSYCMKSIITLYSPDGFCTWGERKVDA